MRGHAHFTDNIGAIMHEIQPITSLETTLSTNYTRAFSNSGVVEIGFEKIISVLGRPISLISSKSRVYLLEDRDLV